MNISSIIFIAALVSILANFLKVWEFGSSHIKKIYFQRTLRHPAVTFPR